MTKEIDAANAVNELLNQAHDCESFKPYNGAANIFHKSSAKVAAKNIGISLGLNEIESICFGQRLFIHGWLACEAFYKGEELENLLGE